MNGDFENGNDAMNQFMLSDEFNDYTASRNVGAPVGQRNAQQETTLLRPSPVDLDLMRVRAENPFCEIMLLPDFVNAAIVRNDIADQNIKIIDIPDSAKYAVLSAGSPFSTGDIFGPEKSLYVGFNNNQIDLNVGASVKNGNAMFAAWPIFGKMLYVKGKKSIIIKMSTHGPSPSYISYVTVGFYF